MKTSEVINKLVDSLKSYGDLPTNIKNISWYCPSENGSFEGINLHSFNDSDEIIEDEFIDIEELPFNNGMNNLITMYEEIEKMNYKINDLIENQKKIIERLKDSE